MKSLADLFKNHDKAMKEFLKHPRFKYLEEIYKLVNTDRIAAGYKVLPMSFFAVKTGEAKMSLTDFDYLVKKMRASTAPGKIFFGLLKVKKTQPPQSTVRVDG